MLNLDHIKLKWFYDWSLYVRFYVIVLIVYRMSLAVMPRDSLPESKYAIMQRLREMNSQLAAIDQMSNNMERDYKSTRLVSTCL